MAPAPTTPTVLISKVSPCRVARSDRRYSYLSTANATALPPPRHSAAMPRFASRCAMA